MNVAVLSYEPAIGAEPCTASASGLGAPLLRERIKSLAGPTAGPTVTEPKTVEDRLGNARRETEAAISWRRSYLGDQMADALLARARAMFDADEWHDQDRVPSTMSIMGTIRAVASIGGEASLGVSNGGNLTATWQEADWSLNIEYKQNGKLSWAYVVEGPHDFDLQGNEQGSLTEVLQAIQGQ